MLGANIYGGGGAAGIYYIVRTFSLLRLFHMDSDEERENAAGETATRPSHKPSIGFYRDYSKGAEMPSNDDDESDDGVVRDTDLLGNTRTVERDDA